MNSADHRTLSEWAHRCDGAEHNLVQQIEALREYSREHRYDQATAGKLAALEAETELRRQELAMRSLVRPQRLREIAWQQAKSTAAVAGIVVAACALIVAVFERFAK